MKLTAGAVAVLAGLAGVGLVGWFAAGRARQLAAGLPDALAAVGNSINPLNSNNVFASGANAATSAITGREETFGGWIRSVTSDDDERIREMLRGTTAKPANTGGATGSWDEPTRYDQMGNVIY